MKRVTVSIALVTAYLVGTSSAHAWWSNGHEHITDGAVSHLPEPLAAYFQSKQAILMAYSGLEPPGRHYIDIDYYPEFFAGTFPRELDDLISLYGAAVVENNGTAPWTVEDYTISLTGMMASATTAEDWSSLLYTAGALAHYVEDLHNPCHLTLNYNGQLTGNDGIHARYEGELISRHLDDIVIGVSTANCVYWPDPADAMLDSIEINYWFVDAIMDADTDNRGTPPNYNEAYYTGMWNDTGAFTSVLFQEASEAVASAWYTAWANAGFPNPIYEPGSGDYDADGDIDLQDLAAFQGCFTGADQGPASGQCASFFFDGDSDIDLADWASLRANITGPASSSGSCTTLAQARAVEVGTEVDLCGAIIHTATDLISSSSYRDLHIQDATGGLKVFGANSAINSILAQATEGDEIRLHGVMAEYRGVLELVADFELLGVDGSPGIPSPIPTTANDFQSQSATAEALESMLVVLPCAEFQDTGAFSGATSYQVTTADGDVEVVVSTYALNLVGEAIPSDAVDLIGVFSQSDSSVPYNGGYRLLLRSMADIQAAATCP